MTSWKSLCEKGSYSEFFWSVFFGIRTEYEDFIHTYLTHLFPMFSFIDIWYSTYDILKIIRNLNPNKAHGHDMINIRMLKIFDESICKPLSIIFQSCLENGKFPSEWKKTNVVPVFKKNNKQELKNYRPISLLPVSGKIFERLLYNSMFKFSRRTI